MVSTSSALAIAAITACSTSALAAPLSGQSCVLGSSGLVKCSPPEPVRSFGTSLSVRPVEDSYGSGGGDEMANKSCTDGDIDCWCLEAMKITNDIRAKAGKGPLKAGPVAMLKNAVDHSKDMSSTLGMVHQDLSEATDKVGCDVFIPGENVAWFSGSDEDPTKKLMKQWEESPPHLKNILSDNPDYVAIGIFTGSDGATWGTQTFGQSDGSKCPMVGGGGGEGGGDQGAGKDSADVTEAAGGGGDRSPEEDPVEYPESSDEESDAPASYDAPASGGGSGSPDSVEQDDDEMSAYGGEDSATTSPPVVTTGMYNAGDSDGDYTKKSVEGENEGENEANDYSGEQSGDSGRYGSNGRTSEMSKDSQEGTSENSTGGQQSLSEGCARFVKWAARMLQL